MKNKHFFNCTIAFTFLMYAFTFSLFAQNLTIKGTVTDETGLSVIGASIVVSGDATHGTVTDIDGMFTLSNVPLNGILEFSYVGMKTQVIPVNGKTVINVTMASDAELLDEIVVVGYGTQRKANLTGAVSAVKMDEVLGDRPVSNTFAALQGTIPGLSITGNSTPGQANKSINIRGTLSINGGNPLILIDNVPGDLNMINPEDIESVSVLKDAASSAIYGARAANGVILVATKRPMKQTQFQLNYNNNFGFERSINLPKQAPLKDYFQAYLDAGFNNAYWANTQDVTKWMQYLQEYKANPSAFETMGDGIYVDDTGIPYYLNEKNLAENILSTGFYSGHNISASGGTEKIRYRMSGGFTSENGPLITQKDYFKRYNIGTFVSADMTDWFTQEIDVRYAQSKKTMPQERGGDIFTLNLVNYYPEGIMPGSLTLNGKDTPIFTPKNTILLGPVDNTVRNNPRIFTKSILKPAKDLEMVFEYTYDKDDLYYSFFSDQWLYTTIQLAATLSPPNDYLIKRRAYTDYNAINTYATYSKLIRDHNFKLMAGYNQESSFYENIRNEVYDQVSSVIPSLGNSTGEKIINENYSEYSIRGGFFRFNYNYQNKYLLELNGRYDGSSKFPKTNRFGFFPSVSAGWQVTKERFMNFSKNWLEELKFRLSYGKIGNQAINPYQYTPDMSINNANDVWLINGTKVTTIGLPSLVSKTFTWENVETFDIGLDLSVLNNRLRGTADWYQRDTKGMITEAGALELPAVVGTEAPAQNGADMRTRGWELAINWRDNIGKVKYNIGFNLFDHKSVITKFANEAGLFYDRNDGQNAKRYREGMVLGEIWGYITDGYYSVDDFESTTTWKLKENVTSIEEYNVRPGDIKFKNLLDDETSTNQIDNGDNTINNPGDRKIIGNSTPRFQFGANLGVSYMGFDLNTIIQGVAKRDVWIGGNAIFPFNGNSVFAALYYNQTDYWRPVSDDPEDPNYMVAQNPNSTYYRLYGQVQNVNSNRRISDKYLQNAAYMRIKNVTLSYVFPKPIIEKIKLKQLKMFVSVENLTTFSYLPSGIDPERTNWEYPFYRTISCGTSITF